MLEVLDQDYSMRKISIINNNTRLFIWGRIFRPFPLTLLVPLLTLLLGLFELMSDRKTEISYIHLKL